jgi:hypothetical protein
VNAHHTTTVRHADDGGAAAVARGRTQSGSQGEHGKTSTASAKFAQILGEFANAHRAPTTSSPATSSTSMEAMPAALRHLSKESSQVTEQATAEPPIVDDAPKRSQLGRAVKHDRADGSAPRVQGDTSSAKNAPNPVTPPIPPAPILESKSEFPAPSSPADSDHPAAKTSFGAVPSANPGAPSGQREDAPAPHFGQATHVVPHLHLDSTRTSPTAGISHPASTIPATVSSGQGYEATARAEDRHSWSAPNATSKVTLAVTPPIALPRLPGSQARQPVQASGRALRVESNPPSKPENTKPGHAPPATNPQGTTQPAFTTAARNNFPAASDETPSISRPTHESREDAHPDKPSSATPQIPPEKSFAQEALPAVTTFTPPRSTMTTNIPTGETPRTTGTLQTPALSSDPLPPSVSRHPRLGDRPAPVVAASAHGVPPVARTVLPSEPNLAGAPSAVKDKSATTTVTTPSKDTVAPKIALADTTTATLPRTRETVSSPQHRDATDDAPTDKTNAAPSADLAAERTLAPPAMPPAAVANRALSPDTPPPTQAPRDGKRKDAVPPSEKGADPSAARPLSIPTVSTTPPTPPKVSDDPPILKADSSLPAEGTNPTKDDSFSRHQTQPETPAAVKDKSATATVTTPSKDTVAPRIAPADTTTATSSRSRETVSSPQHRETDDARTEKTNAAPSTDPAAERTLAPPATPSAAVASHALSPGANPPAQAPRAGKRKDAVPPGAKVADPSAARPLSVPPVSTTPPTPPKASDDPPVLKTDSSLPAESTSPTKDDSFSRHQTQSETTARTTTTQAPAPNPTHADHAVLFQSQPALAIGGSAKLSTDAWTPPLLPTDSAGLVDRVADDPGLSITLLPHSAHLAIASNNGDLALHVRVRDGNADVNVTGTMSPLFDTKAPEVRTVLAGEGLSLGSFATDQQNGQSGQQSQQGQSNSAITDRDMFPPAAAHRSAASSPENHTAGDRHIHVTA